MGDVQYTLNKNNHIVAVNQSFINFARDNDWNFDSQVLINSPLSQYIDGEETKLLTELLISRVRASGLGVSLPFRCDSADKRRYLTMTITPVTNGLLSFNNCLTKQEPRGRIDFLKDHRLDAGHPDMICMCSWCNQFKMSSKLWVEVEEAIDRLYLFSNRYKGHRISHGLCPECKDVMLKSAGGE
ncbi:hypothetical protein [Dasania marina]|uniref:hypothetical protein n=1 Tax=Dasania marina TaxID=471499 RepID=UPI0030D7BBA0|tara:strand:+ start:160125 stop:160679 length:555 start_codon:yes stop_codon:yes gene_type:complete